jgi:hypothetical protein
MDSPLKGIQLGMEQINLTARTSLPRRGIEGQFGDPGGIPDFDAALVRSTRAELGIELLSCA